MKANVQSLFIFIFLGLFAVNANAKEVKIKANGLTLNAYLEIADGKKLSDGVVLMTHGTMAHGKMEIIATLQELLKENGINTLSITLGLGVDNRHGMYDCAIPHIHKNTDSLDEIGLWLNWLKKQGAKKITLLGHSRSGMQSAWFVTERDDPAIKNLVLFAPATGDKELDSEEYKESSGKELETVLDKARALVKAGKSKTMLEHVTLLHCRDTSVSAEAFLSYYEPDPRFDSPYLLPKINKPMLVFVAGADQINKALQKKMVPITDGKKIQTKIIEGSSHFFRDLNAEEAVEHMIEWLKTI